MTRSKNEDKPNISKTYPILLEQMSKILDFGDKKYGKMNWKTYEDINEIVSALDRHKMAWELGETEDSQTGMSHMSHVACNAMFLLWYEINKPEKLKDLYYNKSQKITNNMVANYTDSGWGLRRVACKNMDLEKFKEKFDNIFIKNLVKTMEKM